MKKTLFLLSVLLLTGPNVKAQSWYGAPWGADNLSNITIGQYIGRKASFRIRAEHTGTTEGLRIYFIYVMPGYAAGDGGDILIEVRTDDGSVDHLPSGTVLGSATVYDPMAENFPYIPISADLTEGDLYHIVFSNVDPDPVGNYVSIDDLFIWNPTSPMQPTIRDEDFAVLYKRAENWDWELNDNHTAIYNLIFTDGSAQGMGYMDAKTSYVKTIDGTNRIRQTFIVNGGDKIVPHANVRVKKVSGGGDLTVRLEEYGGTLIEEGPVAEEDINTIMGWVSYSFSQGYLLEDGEAYNLVLSSAGGEYSMNPIQQGTYYGFHEDTVFDDGVMYYDDGGGWQSFPFEGDMQFYFDVLEDYPSAADINMDGTVDADDIAVLVSEGNWGEADPDNARSDISDDGEVDAIDLGMLMSEWEPAE